jgi:hypothetical protein
VQDSACAAASRAHHRDHGMLTSTSVTCGVGTPMLPIATLAVITHSGVAAGPSNHERSSTATLRSPKRRDQLGSCLGGHTVAVEDFDGSGSRSVRVHLVGEVR